MKKLDASEAMALLDALLDDVERGESVVIVRDGKSVARLIPDRDERLREIDQAIVDIKARRRQTKRVTPRLA
jgi:antitoxin (DNA-binding transcriptional repressor) of toxin-antitoxin stability system